MNVQVLEPKDTGKSKLKVGAYCRVSTDSKSQGSSFENQVQYYEKLIRKNPEYKFVQVYADQGLSGTSENRAEFQRMIEDAKTGKLNLIYTKSISRFARDTITVLKYARELKECGVGIFFEEQRITTLTSEGELMLTVLASFAQEESRSISENNKWAVQKKFKRGDTMINTSRFMGYDKDKDGNLVVNAAEAKTVKRIFKLYLEGYGTFRIARILNAEGVKTVTGAQWRDSTIIGMIQNEKYKGDVWLQKYFTPDNRKNKTKKNIGQKDSYYIKDNHKPIISEQDWNRAQEVMEMHRKEKGMKAGNKEKYQNRYPLSGMLLCPHCMKTLRRCHLYNGKIAWRCSTYVTKGKGACVGISIDDCEVANRNITEPTVVEEEYNNGEKHYLYTSAKDYKKRTWKATIKEAASSSVLPSVDRPRRTAIKL